MTSKIAAIAMSGGVDSSVAACILKDMGYDVFGITMFLSQSGKKVVDTAKQVATKLDIPHYVIDLTEPFDEKIIEPFCHEHGRGKTPNPCIFCNYHIKFGVLLDRAIEMGADFLATGHYVRILETRDGFKLLKGIDFAKDQSYFLYRLRQEQLQYILTPLGGLTKAEVKKIASELTIDAIVGRESQDICFIPDNHYDEFISTRIKTEPGDILDINGKAIGRHQGLAYYTIGQRQGLGLVSTGRRYIVEIDSQNNTIILGDHDQLFQERLSANKLTWISGHRPQITSGITGRIRYRAVETPVKLRYRDDFCEVEFEQPQWAITPGQSIVFYSNEEVLGGGIIENHYPAKD
jgi:tRNA-specific 2-thiouridylase